MKTIKAKCVICGEVDVSVFDTEDGTILPTALCPTLEDVQKYLDTIIGNYEKATGNKIEDCFEKGFPQLSHESPDDVGWDEAKKHTLEPIECWVEIV